MHTDAPARTAKVNVLAEGDNAGAWTWQQSSQLSV